MSTFNEAMEAMKWPHKTKSLAKIQAPQNGVCEHTGALIRAGETCLERIKNDGSRAWFAQTSNAFKAYKP